MDHRLLDQDREREETGAHPGELTAVAHGAGFALIGRILGNGLRYLSQFLIARLLGPQAYGLYALGLAVYRLMEIAASWGLQHGAVRYTSIFFRSQDHPRLKGVLYDAVRLPLAAGSALGLLLYISAPAVAETIFQKPSLTALLQVFALAVPFGAALNVSVMATTGFLTTRYLVYIREVFQPLAFIVAIFILYGAGFGALSPAAAWSLAAFLGLLFCLYAVRRIYPSLFDRTIPSSSSLPAMLAFSTPLLAAEFLTFALLWTDILMLGYFRTAGEVGIYNVAGQTALLVVLVLGAVNTIFSPMIASLHHRGERQELAELYKTTTLWSFILSLPIFLLLWVAGKDLLWLFGPDFPAGWQPLVILAGAQLINAATGSVGFMLIMGGRPYRFLVTELTLVSANIVLNALLIPKWGLVGAAVATGASIASVNLLRIVQIYLLDRMQPYDGRYLKVLAAGAISLAGALLLRNWLPEPHPLLAIATGLATLGGLYSLSLWFLGIGREGRRVWEALKESRKL